MLLSSSEPFPSQLSALPTNLNEIATKFPVLSTTIDDAANYISTFLLPSLPVLPSIPALPFSLPPFAELWGAFEDQALAGNHLDPRLAAAVTLFSFVVSAVANPINYPLEAPYGPAEKYSPTLAAEFYSKRPGIVLQRCLQLAFSGTPLGISLLIDRYITKKDEDSATKKIRAKSLLEFVERNGCTYIKIGQAASVREDIIDEEYAKELSKLQDSVPPFPSSQAKVRHS